MKKFFLLILAFILIYSLIGCETTDYSEENNTNKIVEIEKHQHHYGEWQINKEPTCISEGEKIRSCICGDYQTTNIPILEEHRGVGKCADCGLDYFDVMADYVLKHSDSAGTNHTIEYYHNSSTYPYIILYSESTNSIQVKNSNQSLNNTTYFVMYKSSTKYGEYHWYHYIIAADGVYSRIQSIEGTIDAMKIYVNEPISLSINESSIQSISSQNLAKSNAEKNIKIFINEILPLFLEDCGENISMKNLSFERFEP